MDQVPLDLAFSYTSRGGRALVAATAVSHNATVDGHYSNQFSTFKRLLSLVRIVRKDQAGTIIGRVVRNDQIKKSEHFPKSEFSVPTKSFSYHNSDVGTQKAIPIEPSIN